MNDKRLLLAQPNECLPVSNSKLTEAFSMPREKSYKIQQDAIFCVIQTVLHKHYYGPIKNKRTKAMQCCHGQGCVCSTRCAKTDKGLLMAS